MHKIHFFFLIEIFILLFLISNILLFSGKQRQYLQKDAQMQEITRTKHI